MDHLSQAVTKCSLSLILHQRLMLCKVLRILFNSSGGGMPSNWGIPKLCPSSWILAQMGQEGGSLPGPFGFCAVGRLDRCLGWLTPILNVRGNQMF